MIIYSISDIQKALYALSFRNKYDLMANEMAREIFQSVINNQSEFHKYYPEYNVALDVTVRRENADYIEQNKNNFVRFKIDAYNEGVLENSGINQFSIIIAITLAKGFSEKDYEGLSFRLYEVSRHELEHMETYNIVGKPSPEYERIFNDINLGEKSNSLRGHCELMSKYILDPQELPSYAKSIYYYAKKIKKDFNSVVQEILERSFYNNNPQNINEAGKDKEIIRLFNVTKEAIIDKIKDYYPNTMYRMYKLPVDLGNSGKKKINRRQLQKILQSEIPEENKEANEVSGSNSPQEAT